MFIGIGLGLVPQAIIGSTSDAAGGDSGALFVLLEDGSEVLLEDNSNLLTES